MNVKAERGISLINLIATPDRNSLDIDTIDMLTFINKNVKHLHNCEINKIFEDWKQDGHGKLLFKNK